MFETLASDIELPANSDPTLKCAPARMRKCIGLIDAITFNRECSTQALQTAFPDTLVISFPDLDEFLERPDLLNSVRVMLLNAYGRASCGPEIDLTVSSLRQGHGDIAVVLVAESDRPEYVRDALSRGVRGYIARNATIDIVVHAIKLVDAGGVFIPATSVLAQMERGASETARTDFAVRYPGQPAFTPTQMKVLRPLSEGKATKIIAHELQLSESTVKIHIRNIMQKLRATNRTQVALFAQRMLASEADLILA